MQFMFTLVSHFLPFLSSPNFSRKFRQNFARSLLIIYFHSKEDLLVPPTPYSSPHFPRVQWKQNLLQRSSSFWGDSRRKVLFIRSSSPSTLAWSSGFWGFAIKFPTKGWEIGGNRWKSDDGVGGAAHVTCRGNICTFFFAAIRPSSSKPSTSLSFIQRVTDCRAKAYNMKLYWISRIPSVELLGKSLPRIKDERIIELRKLHPEFNGCCLVRINT